jgi:hypothetical protein
MMHGKAQSIEGGKKVKAVKPQTAKEWCAFWGVEVKDKIAMLYKGVGDDFRSQHGGDYTPGSTPKSDTWTTEEECGSGLHFSPTPRHTLEFNSSATKFVRCGVKVTEIVIHPDGDYPSKCKAPRVFTPCVEVDITSKERA